MEMDASSVTSSSVSRASMLERQRQVALRRRQNQIQSASIMRTNATVQQNIRLPFNDGQIQMTNQPLHFQQQVLYQTNQLVHADSMMHHGYIDNRGFLAMNQMIPANATSHQMVPYDDGQGQSYYRQSCHSSASDSHHNIVQYKPSGDDMSELTDARTEGPRHSYRHAPPRCVSVEDDEKSSNRRSTFSFIDIEEDDIEMKINSPISKSRSASKLQRRTSSRSLSFNDNPEHKMHRQTSSSNASKMSIGESSKEESEQRIIQFLNEMESVTELDVDNPAMMRAFLTRPCPKGVGMMRCYIKRNKGIKNKLFPGYRVYLKENNAFLMTSKKRMGNATSNYLISMGRNDFDNRQSPNVLGKLRSNFLGTEYTIYDGGRNPQYESSFEDDGDANVRCELGAIFYAASTTLGAKGPRKMKACIGKLDDGNNPAKVWMPMKEDDDRMVTCFKDKDSQNNLVTFVNKNPSWNEEIKAYALNFNGRVTMESVKNFQLIDESDPEKIYLQFGRTGKDEFILDLQWPLSPLQAFAFALSSFDSKLGCD